MNSTIFIDNYIKANKKNCKKEKTKKSTEIED
jgi:hypothetical protein